MNSQSGPEGEGRLFPAVSAPVAETLVVRITIGARTDPRGPVLHDGFRLTPSVVGETKNELYAMPRRSASRSVLDHSAVDRLLAEEIDDLLSAESELEDLFDEMLGP